MCFHLYTHHTTPDHDTRFLSTLNPVTGYKVRSPFQDPFIGKCDYPCRLEQLKLEEACPWHGGCCRLERREICRWGAVTPGTITVNGRRNKQTSIGNCIDWFNYHRLVYIDDGGLDDETSFLQPFFKSEPGVIALAANFFKVGVELTLATTYHIQIAQKLTRVDGGDNQVKVGDQGQGNEGESAVIGVPERTELERHLGHFNRVIQYAESILAQFARLWDLKTMRGEALTRPGREPYPEHNWAVIMGLELVMEGWDGNDEGTITWPHNVELWPQLHLHRHSFLSRHHSHIMHLPVTIMAILIALLVLTQPSRAVLGQDYLPSSGSTSASPSRSLNPSVRIKSSSSNDSTSNDATDDATDDTDSEISGAEYDVEALVDHRPKGVSRSQVRFFKVRWEGDQWSPSQKETWERKRNIAPHLVRNYWKSFPTRRRKGET
ncbi:hypothetical protein F4779DRAFT_629026 [Xylariaceae sp. FL0662B]|nr:hypothetical protein F4779DRAFT_629026 [Xylariaceae sp. FL0662B]